MGVTGWNESRFRVPSDDDGDPVYTVTEMGTRLLGGIGTRLLDDAYSSWLAAEINASASLSVWFGAAGRGREDAYTAYVASVDREQAAAHDLQRLLKLAARSTGARRELDN